MKAWISGRDACAVVAALDAHRGVSSSSSSKQDRAATAMIARFREHFETAFQSCLARNKRHDLDAHELLEVPLELYALLRAMGFCTFLNADAHEMPLFDEDNVPVCVKGVQVKTRDQRMLNLARDVSSRFQTKVRLAGKNARRKDEEDTKVRLDGKNARDNDQLWRTAAQEWRDRFSEGDGSGKEVAPAGTLQPDDEDVPEKTPASKETPRPRPRQAQPKKKPRVPVEEVAVVEPPGENVSGDSPSPPASPKKPKLPGRKVSFSEASEEIMPTGVADSPPTLPKNPTPPGEEVAVVHGEIPSPSPGSPTAVVSKKNEQWFFDVLQKLFHSKVPIPDHQRMAAFLKAARVPLETLQKTNSPELRVWWRKVVTSRPWLEEGTQAADVPRAEGGGAGQTPAPLEVLPKKLASQYRWNQILTVFFEAVQNAQRLQQEALGPRAEGGRAGQNDINVFERSGKRQETTRSPFRHALVRGVAVATGLAHANVLSRPGPVLLEWPHFDFQDRADGGDWCSRRAYGGDWCSRTYKRDEASCVAASGEGRCIWDEENKVCKSDPVGFDSTLKVLANRRHDAFKALSETGVAKRHRSRRAKRALQKATTTGGSANDARETTKSRFHHGPMWARLAVVGLAAITGGAAVARTHSPPAVAAPAAGVVFPDLAENHQSLLKHVRQANDYQQAQTEAKTPEQETGARAARIESRPHSGWMWPRLATTGIAAITGGAGVAATHPSSPAVSGLRYWSQQQTRPTAPRQRGGGLLIPDWWEGDKDGLMKSAQEAKDYQNKFGNHTHQEAQLSHQRTEDAMKRQLANRSSQAARFGAGPSPPFGRNSTLSNDLVQNEQLNRNFCPRLVAGHPVQMNSSQKTYLEQLAYSKQLAKAHAWHDHWSRFNANRYAYAENALTDATNVTVNHTGLDDQRRPAQVPESRPTSEIVSQANVTKAAAAPSLEDNIWQNDYLFQNYADCDIPHSFAELSTHLTDDHRLRIKQEFENQCSETPGLRMCAEKEPPVSDMRDFGKFTHPLSSWLAAGYRAKGVACEEFARLQLRAIRGLKADHSRATKSLR